MTLNAFIFPKAQAEKKPFNLYSIQWAYAIPMSKPGEHATRELWKVDQDHLK